MIQIQNSKRFKQKWTEILLLVRTKKVIKKAKLISNVTSAGKVEYIIECQ